MKARDNRGRVLSNGESQMVSGKYRYVYFEDGIRRWFVSRRLKPEDKVPMDQSHKMSIQEFRELHNL